MLVLVIDLLVIVLIAVLVVISFGISTKVIWSAIIALSLYFFIAIRGWNVNKTGTHPHFVKRWSPTGLKEIIGFCKKVRMAEVLKPKQKFGTGTVLQSFNGFGIQRNSGNYLPKVLVARVLSQLPILSLFPMEIVETN